MKILYLPLKKKYFDQVQSGEKKVEYRLRNKYWEARLLFKHYDKIVLTRGYPKNADHARRIEKPYRGYDVVKIKHPEWSNQEQTCFAIKL